MGYQLSGAEHRSDLGAPAVARRPWPTRPVIIRTLPLKPLQFDDLKAMARHIHGARGQEGLEFGGRQVAHYGPSDTFTGFNLWILRDTGDKDWVGFCAFQSETLEPLKEALRATEGQPAVGVAA